MAILRAATARRFCAVVAVASLLCADPSAQTFESEVKAAFLFNFTKFVEWPSSAFESATAPLRLCVVADAAFTHNVDEIIAGETVRGRVLRRVTPAATDLAQCHVLYVASAESVHTDKLLSAVRRAPVLTVGESPRFLEQGGAIAFALVNGRVRFDVNLDAAEATGLTISSKLLRVARYVRGNARS